MNAVKDASYVISRENGIVRIDFRRSPNREEVLNLAEELNAIEDASLRLYVIVDANILLSTAEVKEGAEYAKSLDRQPDRIAVVAPNDISHGISRLFKVFRESPETELQVFRTLEEARAWLGAGANPDA